MKRFPNYIYNRDNRRRGLYSLNKFIDRRTSKINKFIADSKGKFKGLNVDIHNLFMRAVYLEIKTDLIDPQETRQREHKLYESLEKMMEEHSEFFKALDDYDD